jgi:hypothetical protein
MAGVAHCVDTSAHKAEALSKEAKLDYYQRLWAR